MLSRGQTVLACVSGGTDSMCLLDVLHKLSKEMGFALSAAHFNHRLRGEESDGDETFVRKTCEKLDIPLYIGSGDAAGEAERRGRGIEETARDMRYAFFFKTAGENHINKVATAHNADDNLETVLMRVVRGTGLRGLCGIPPVRGMLIRPLLNLTRAQIEAYNLENNIPHREDSTNASDDYTRNLLRHKVTPVLSSLNPSLNITPMTGLLRKDEEALTALAEGFFEGQTEDELDTGALLALPYSVSSRVIRLFCGKELSRDHVEAVLSLAASADPSARLDLPGVTLRREYGKLLADDAEEKTFSPREITLDSPVIIEDAGLSVTAEKVVFDGGIYKSLTTFPVKWDKIVGKLEARPRRSGDTLRLGGMTRSLKKLLIDRKIPRHLRDRLPVIADERGPIAVYKLGMDRNYLPDKGDPAIIIKIEERMNHA